MPVDDFSLSANSISGESTLVYQDVARQVQKTKGIRIINFGIGQPDLPTFARIREAAKKSLDEGFTGYTSAYGIDELRQKIAEHLSSKYESVRKEEVIVTPGAKTALYLAFLLYINPGDEVIIFDPSFYSYAEVVKMLGGVPVYVKMKFNESTGFSLNLSELESKINKKTKMIVLNNPHNPTGMVFDPIEIEKLMEITKEKKVLLLSDEIYDYFIYEGKMKSVLEDPDWRDYVIYVNGFSKTFSMTGWRLGYVVAKEKVIKKMAEIAANIYTCPTSFAQKGALAAFESFDEVKEMISLFKKRRDIMYEELKKIKGIQVHKSQGAFYMFPFIGEILKKANLSVKDFSLKLIEEKGVTTIPGEVFPLEVGKDFVRLSFAVKEDDIREGIKRMKEFIDMLMTP
ncbi:pyridoxal phosphate-dependent aminotransferase [Sulfurisphaera tokodaii]|uniref:Aspartate aminotransferase n=2 Tax=Sulfurisphaera tokodaii TaxID=111955 RepID=AAT_SULTO|nr:pyridoxal phosphate-dependent aminotransferase [Sulfurisphaera tokodaii]Q972A2.1 RecName: Full=Aspartate aminotransferase; Short=AspAT; AltName: Full=Transaminase A [Sulfurisphaera tokodaii str. 7]BAB66267.1 aspartate aminotransferase [Sulfurisphaera tokodaii str. 7]HII73248.1 pyridoxal phosphate-dependent aminotransferase [Sulfurisphaera tokodaii]